MRFITKPILGVKPDVPVDDGSLVQMAGESSGLTHDTGGQNIVYDRKRNSCTKAFGFSQRSASAAEAGSVVVRLFELTAPGTRANVIITNEKFFAYNSGEVPVEIELIFIDYSSLAAGDGTVAPGDTVTGDTTATTATVVTGTTAASGELFISDITGGTGDFSATESLTFSGGETANCDSIVTAKALSQQSLGYGITRYGDYMVVGDSDTGNSPFKYKVGDANLTNLITATDATLYQFRFMAEWYLHLIGLYSDQTSGDIEIRWTAALPGSSVSFPAANQLYVPTNDSITGTAKLGYSNFLIYGKDSISKLDYYPSATPIFGIRTLVDGYGSVNRAGLVSAYGSHWFYNSNYGFIRYAGGSKIDSSNIISQDIETIISDIPTNKHTLISGVELPRSRQIVWAIPITATFPTMLLFYDVDRQMWTKVERTTRNITAMDAWTESTTEPKELVVTGIGGATYDGNVYSFDGEIDQMSAGTLYNGYRIEPAMYFGRPNEKKLLKELWFGIVEGGSYYLDVFYRNGNTAKEITGSSWQFIGSLSLDDPDPPVMYMPSLITSVGYDNLAGGTFSIGGAIIGATNSYTATVMGDIRTSATEGTVYLLNLSGVLENNEEFGDVVTADCTGVSVDTVINPTARLHQIKWGTDEDSEKFSINRIDYIYEHDGEY